VVIAVRTSNPTLLLLLSDLLIIIIKKISQRPEGLKHELSSLAITLRSWARIPLEAWTSLFFCVCVVLCR
jgi:hypothetical protein